MKVLCVHGIGKQSDSALTWQPVWRRVLTENLIAANPNAAPVVDFLDYDDLFGEPLANLSYRDFATALWNLTTGAFTRSRGLFDFSDSTRWYAGMVVVWVNQEDLRAELQTRLLEKIEEFKPDVIVAHSLGALIAYDTFAHDEEAIRDRTLITLGAQIGNLFVRGSAFGGRVEPLTTATNWFHLYNENDHVFTAPLDYGEFLTADNFQQVLTTFGNYWSGFATNHTAEDYLNHEQTAELVWPQVAGTPAVRALIVPPRAARQQAAVAAPKVRALLVGVNAYPDQARRLEGCVNDVFLMSSLLQECGFDGKDILAEDIRIVLDERATAASIRERLHWLLDGVKDGDMRFFYYSGHGAQVPIYGPEEKIDRVASCLAPHDFNWTQANAIMDSDLVNFYSQLPYDARFMMVLDCCYSGGITRAGGGPRARGLEPPDDIRHRMLRWDKVLGMWKPRDLPPLNKDLSKLSNAQQFVGETGATLRLGRAVALRVVPDKEYDKTRKALAHKGPFMPIVYEACGEQELAYEYQHGAISYGAFTYALANVLRRVGKITFEKLLKETAKVLKDLRYAQHPEAAGPKAILKAQVPWQGPGADADAEA